MDYSQRPNRSDTHLSKEDETRVEHETRQHFDELAPKRHSKPQRSEYSQAYTDNNTNAESIPENIEFQRLEHDQEKLRYDGSQMTEEFVETEYYKDLNCVDKQHHTTGTGFIKMDSNNEKGSDSMAFNSSATSCHESSHGNPATNDWIPAAADQVTMLSGKPTRSDN